MAKVNAKTRGATSKSKPSPKKGGRYQFGGGRKHKRVSTISRRALPLSRRALPLFRRALAIWRKRPHLEDVYQIWRGAYAIGPTFFTLTHQKHPSH